MTSAVSGMDALLFAETGKTQVLRTTIASNKEDTILFIFLSPLFYI
jgi:hypothetical protein